MGVSFAIQRYCMTEPISSPDQRIGPLTFTCIRLVFSTLFCYLIRPAVKLVHKTVHFVSVKSGLNLLALELDEMEGKGNHPTPPPTTYESVGVTDLDNSMHSDDRIDYGIDIEDSDYKYGSDGNHSGTSVISDVNGVETTCTNWGDIFKDNLQMDCRNSSESCQNDFCREVCHEDNTLWTSGGAVGISDGVAAILQQISLVTISGGKCAFITTMYVIVVPVISYLAPCLTNKMTKMAWVAGMQMYFVYECTMYRDSHPPVSGFASFMSNIYIIFLAFTFVSDFY